ncbi:MAG: LysR family transcriptional regulator [Lachnospiraceae bacterium]
MDIKQLQYFVTCAQTNSFSTAAEMLYTSQPHVSMVINTLEKELGCRLFQRAPRGVTLTPAGVRNYEYAMNILKHSRLMFSSGQEEHETFAIYTNSSSNMSVLFTRFFKDHPDLRYRYIEAGAEEIIEKVALHESDIGFIFVPSNKETAFNYTLQRKKVTYIPLTTSDLVVYAGKNNPLYTRTIPLQADELKDLSFIQMTDDFFTMQDLVDDILADTFSVIGPPVIETNSNHVMIRILESTDLCNMCSYWLKDRYKQNDFRMIPVLGLENKISFGYIRNRDESLSPAAEEFLALVADAIEQER